jgi:flagellar motor switch protein FliG
MEKGEQDRVQPPENGFMKKVDREKGYKRAAEFLLLLGKEKAASVIARLSHEEVEGITREIALLDEVDRAEAKRVLAEFGLPATELEKSQASIKGGLETAESMLKAALGEDRSREILERVERKLAPDYFNFLKDVPESHLETLLKDESPQVLSLVLAHLEAAQSSRLLKKLPAETQMEVVRRIAKMDKLLPEVIRRTADSLKKKLFAQGDFSTLYLDGKSALKNILKHMDYGREQTILDGLSEEKPDLARELERELFTVDIVRKLAYKDLQLFLRELTDRDLAMLVKGEPDDLTEYVLSGISNRRREQVNEESRILGEVPRQEAEKTKRVVLDILKMKIGKGEVTLLDEDASTVV